MLACVLSCCSNTATVKAIKPGNVLSVQVRKKNDFLDQQLWECVLCIGVEGTKRFFSSLSDINTNLFNFSVSLGH